MFTAWDGLIRGAVVWAHRLGGGEADPLDTQGRLVTEAPDREVLATLLSEWRAQFADGTTTTADVIRRAQVVDTLHDAIVAVGAEVKGRPDARRLGFYLRKTAGRVIHDLSFERRGERNGVATWAVRTAPGAGDTCEEGGRGGSRGRVRTPSHYVYTRGGPAGARAESGWHSSPSSPSSPEPDPVEAAEREAIQDEAAAPPRWPTCPICARTDRAAGQDAGCRTCREYLAATRERGVL